MRVETIFIMNRAGKKIAIGSMKIRGEKTGSLEILDGGYDIFDYYVENIKLNYEEGDKISH